MSASAETIQVLDATTMPFAPSLPNAQAKLLQKEMVWPGVRTWEE